MSVNKAFLIGRLGQDPEIKYTPTGQTVCNFSIATTSKWLDKNGQSQESTEWHNIVVWGKQGENCNQYLSKGKLVHIEGSLQTRSWTNEQGVKLYKTEIRANSVMFLTPVDGSDSQQPAQQPPTGLTQNQNSYEQPQQQYQQTNFSENDIPF